MAKRKQESYDYGNLGVIQFFDDEKLEYVLEFYRDGMLQLGRTYRTPHLTQAQETTRNFLGLATLPSESPAFDTIIYTCALERTAFRLNGTALEHTPIASDGTIRSDLWEPTETDVWDAQRAELLTTIRRRLTKANAALYDTLSNGG